MPLQRHTECKVSNSAKNIKTKAPPAGRSVSKNCELPQNSANVQKESSASRLPIPIGRNSTKRKEKELENRPGMLNIKGSSTTNKKRTDASVGTKPKANRSHLSKRGDTQTDFVGKSVGTEPRALTVESNITPQAQSQSKDSNATTEVNELSVGPITQTLDDLNFDTEAEKFPSDNLKLIKEDGDPIVVHRQLEDMATFELYRNRLAKIGGSDMRDTVRQIGQKLISDEVLMKYSYLGQRTKQRFKDCDNITKLVIASTIAAMKRRHFEIYGKEKEETDEEKKALHDAVEKYFTSEYIKDASRRYKRSLN